MKAKSLVLESLMRTIMPIFILQLLPSKVIAQTLEPQPSKAYKSHGEFAPQFLRLNANGIIIQAWGGEFSLWYRVNKKWDVGMALQQVLSLKDGGVALISAVKIKGRYHITGGEVPAEQRWSLGGDTKVAKMKSLEGGLSAVFDLEQVSFNTGANVRAYSGFGLLMNYEFPWNSTQSFTAGVGYARLSNGNARLTPMWIQGGIQLYFD